MLPIATAGRTMSGSPNNHPNDAIATRSAIDVMPIRRSRCAPPNGWLSPFEKLGAQRLTALDRDAHGLLKLA